MRGELDFKQSLVSRVGLLKGHSAEDLYHRVRQAITFTPGAEELCATLKARGCARLARTSHQFTEVCACPGGTKCSCMPGMQLETDESQARSDAVAEVPPGGGTRWR